MKKFLKTLVMIILATLLCVTAVACDNGGNGGESKKGLLYKKINGVYTIYKYVDEGTGVKDLNIADYLEEDITNVRIQAQAFNGNDTIETITVPSTVTRIDKGAFAGMKVLKELTVPFIGMTGFADSTIGETADDGEDDVVKSVDSERTIAHFFGDGQFDEGATITVNYGAGSSTCYVPVTLEKITVKPQGEYKIPACAFDGFNMPVEIVLDGNVTVIGDRAFAGATQLVDITLPTTVTKIGNGAFSGATNLKNVNLNALTALESIGANAFEGTALTNVVLPASVTTIGNNVFKDSKVVTVTLSANLQTLGNYAFYNCVKLEKVYTDGIDALEIGVYAFGDCEKLAYFGQTQNEDPAVKTIYVSTFTVNANAFDNGIEYQVK